MSVSFSPFLALLSRQEPPLAPMFRRAPPCWTGHRELTPRLVCRQVAILHIPELQFSKIVHMGQWVKLLEIVSKQTARSCLTCYTCCHHFTFNVENCQKNILIPENGEPTLKVMFIWLAVKYSAFCFLGWSCQTWITWAAFLVRESFCQIFYFPTQWMRKKCRSVCVTVRGVKSASFMLDFD